MDIKEILRKDGKDWTREERYFVQKAMKTKKNPSGDTREQLKKKREVIRG